MRIICNTQALTNVCLNVQRCVPAKAVMPHIEGILIKTTGESKIELSGFDLDLGITTSMNVRIERGGAIVLNAKTLCSALMTNGLSIVGGMTENHLMTLDLRDKGITGKEATDVLEKVGITANKNTVPNDPQSPFVTSGVRLGTCAITTRGFMEEDMEEIAAIIANALRFKNNETALMSLRVQSQGLCDKYPLPY